MKRGKHSRLLWTDKRTKLEVWKCAEWLHGRKDCWFEIWTHKVDLGKCQKYHLMVFETDDYEEAKSFAMGA